MPTTLLKTEADRLTNPSLQRGVIETIIDKGARNLVPILPFDSFEGSSYDYNLEGSQPLDDSAESPYGSDIADGVGEPERVKLDVAMLARDVKTPIVNQQGKSNFNQQRARDVMSGAKRLARDLVTHHINGTGVGVSLNGLEKFLEDFAGRVQANGTTNFDPGQIVRQKEQKIFHTDDDTPGGAASTLDSEVIRTFLTRNGDEPFDMIWTDEQSYVQVQLVVENMPGNTAEHILDENFGRQVLSINGTNVMKLDAVGREKKGLNAVVNVTADTIEIDSTSSGHKKFIGFSDLDIGRSFKLYDGDPNDPQANATLQSEGTVDSLDSTIPHWKVNVTWTSGEPASDKATGDGWVLVLEKTNAMYAARYDAMDGVTAFYHQTRGTPANPGDQYQGPIAGFNVHDIGRSRTGMRAIETQLDWFGNFAVQSPFALARLSHYDFA